MEDYDFFLLNFMEGKLECFIAPRSSILFENILEVWLDFNGKKDKLWQLTDYLQRSLNPETFNIKDNLGAEAKEDLVQISKIFNLEKWAKNRNIPYSFIIRGWGFKSIVLRLFRIAHNFSERINNFNNDRPAI